MTTTNAEVDAKLRNSRQESLAPLARLQEADLVLVGAGAVGRAVAFQLTAMGVRSLTLFDGDTVNTENLAPQAYRPDQLGKMKTDACSEDLRLLNPDVDVIAFHRKFARSDWAMLEGKHIISAADSMTARKNVWESACRAEAKWFGDARVAGETIRVLTETAPVAGGRYEKTLFSEAEAFQGSCTGKMIFFGASAAASLLVANFTQHLRGVALPFTDRMLDLFGWELFDTDTNSA